MTAYSAVPTATPTTADAGRTPPAGRPLALVAELCRQLAEEGVSFCHWKSNEALDRSASGENDLDLLVGRRDVERFEHVLARLGFKEGRLPGWKDLPGVSHRFGFDRDSGSLVHVHAHTQLVIGDDMTKNVRLPVEEAYLASAERRGVFPVPAPEFELAVFVLRMVLKHCSWDSILMLQGALSASEGRELRQLSDEASLDEVAAFVHRHLPEVGAALWRRCFDAIHPGASLTTRVGSAVRLHRALRSCRRRAQPVDTYLKIWRRFRTFGRRKVIRRGPIVTRLASGGVLVAIVGADGAGKSTAVEDLRSWFGREIHIESVHLGKPPRSFVTRLVRGASHLAARARPSQDSSKRALEEALERQSSMTVRTRARLVWELCIARDRYRAYRRARRRASNGAIVVCDRFPLDEITSMDGAVSGAYRAGPDRVVRMLSSREQAIYRRIRRPDLVVVLRIDPELAVARRPEDDPEHRVRPRSEEVQRIAWGDPSAVVIDAGAPLAEVRARVRAALWSAL